ncbi:MAG: Gfo/Idh/MocA family oxidoreductase [Candidatus Vogelbacteria bacterium]|nr:Gfo/Idh/MocA family oxidoreductase [Candidatus Vogelbacteria bacterium]
MIKLNMKILVLGCGSVGKRHIKNLLAINAGEISVFDVDNEKIKDFGQDLPIKLINKIDEVLATEKYEAAFICTPPSFHVSQALQMLEHGMHCFIEKPLADDLAGLDKLIDLAAQKKRVVMVGYNQRFSPILRKIKGIIDNGIIGRVLFLKASMGYYLPYWRPQEDYSQGYGARRELGGGIILDASHDIDYALHFLGEVKEVFAVCGKVSGLKINTEDYAEIIMRFKTGAYAQIHFDYLQSNYRRSCEIVGDKGMLLWDINANELKQYSLKDKEYQVYYRGLNANVNEMYLDEVKHFFNCIQTGAEPLVGLKEAKRVQEIIFTIMKSAKEERFIAI